VEVAEGSIMVRFAFVFLLFTIVHHFNVFDVIGKQIGGSVTESNLPRTSNYLLAMDI
jgi:hypothetical protein